MFFMFFIFLSFQISAQDFETEAKLLASDLKMSLMKNLSQKIKSSGGVQAISFCHSNVKPIAKKAAGKRINKFDFGRTSHKIRNKKNEPLAWAQEYLNEYKGTFKGDKKKEFMIHQLENGKKVYLEALYIQPQCLLCHGDKLSTNISQKLQQIYPEDSAIGFKLNEFRGFIWIKEKD